MKVVNLPIRRALPLKSNLIYITLLELKDISKTITLGVSLPGQYYFMFIRLNFI
ncbi:MAG: hypothetical protein K0Q73_5529 [Paenibacillus sp.]|jgi:hypothetical protein|nr:hypothetical protein [Paenibacillus sp.]